MQTATHGSGNKFQTGSRSIKRQGGFKASKAHSAVRGFTGSKNSTHSYKTHKAAKDGLKTGYGHGHGTGWGTTGIGHPTAFNLRQRPVHSKAGHSIMLPPNMSPGANTKIGRNPKTKFGSHLNNKPVSSGTGSGKTSGQMHPKQNMFPWQERAVLANKAGNGLGYGINKGAHKLVGPGTTHTDTGKKHADSYHWYAQMKKQSAKSFKRR